MAQSTMYPAINNSPQTALAADITANTTTIPVVDASCLPAAPNICTIGVEEDAELISYAAIEDNELRNCVRGFNGTTAKVWAVGEFVYRGITAYDLDTVRANILDLDTVKLNTDGDASDTTAAFEAAATKANISTGEKLSVIFGKIAKWFALFGAAAWRGVGTGASDVADGSHASQHGTNGADPLTAADISAAAAEHASEHGTGGGDPLIPSDIGAAAASVDKPATLTAAGWVGDSAPYTQQVSVNGITATMTPICDLLQSTTASTAKSEIEAWAKVSKIETGAGVITATCYDDKPGVSLNIRIKVVG